MEEGVGATLQCNDKLRSKLHSDDTDKLRRKLAFLQREYLKTQQRLKRSERSEAVKNHVRTRITEHNSLLLPQTDPGDTPATRPGVDPSSPSLRLGSPSREVTSRDRDQHHTEGQVEADGGRKCAAVRFLLPSEAPPPLTPASSRDDQARDQGGATPAPSSALRLRSRRSRLRWQQRWNNSAEAVGSTDTNSEEGQEPGSKLEDKSATEKRAGTPEVVVETQEMNKKRLSGSESESPSLLLTHWNTERHTGEGQAEKKGRVQRRKETGSTGDNIDSESPSLLLPHRTPAPPAGRGTQEDILNHEGTEAVEGERGGGLERELNAGEQQRCDKETNSGQNSDRNEGKARDQSSHTAVRPKADQHQERCEKVEGQCDGEVSLQASCALVEGLLFPPEYYVRTTRRMTSSQQQQHPDMQASLFSNLICTSRRRGRGRGQGRGRNQHSLKERQTQHAGKDVDHSSLTYAYSDTPALMVSSSSSSHEAQCSSEKASDRSLDNPNDECLISEAPSARPMRGRKRKRGRQRGRGFEKGSLCLDISRTDQQQTSVHSVPAMIPSSPSHSFPVAGVLERGPVSVAPAIVSQPPASPLALTPVIPPSAQEDEPTSASFSGSLEQVYPIFRRSGSVTRRPSHDVSGWQSFLLPSPPASSDPLLHTSPLALGSALKRLVTMDFHLPDEQFGSLKLHKLQQVIAATAEPFSPPSYHTRRSSQQAYELYKGKDDQALALSLPLSPTPTLSKSPLSRDDGLHLRVESVNLPCPPAVTLCDPIGERKRIDTQMSPLGSIPVTPVDDCKLDPGAQLPEDGGQLANCPEQVSLREAGSLVRQSSRECMNQSIEQEPSSGTVLEGFAEHLPEVESSPVLTEQQEDGGGVVELLENQRATNRQTAEVNDSDCPAEETIESPFKCNTNCQTIRTCRVPAVQEDHRMTHVTNGSLTDHHTTDSPTDGFAGSPPLQPGACSQLLLSPSLVSPPCPLLTPHLHSSTLPSSPPLPSLGLTPCRALASCLPLTSSPCAPNLTSPSPVSPSTLALSPPHLSPCPLLLSPHRGTPAPVPTSHPTSTSSDPPKGCRWAVPGGCARLRSSCHLTLGVPVDSQPPLAAEAKVPVEQAGENEAVADECAVSFTHTLTAPAGGGLVDACCVLGPSGGLCVVAAGKWAVCVWDQTSTSGWGLIHTWTFNEPVISVFSVPDAAGLLCVSLGQLEIREVRVLSCSSLAEALLCQGVVQAVVGVAGCRVVCSSHSAAISTLQLFVLSEDISAPTPQPLASPGMHVGALATVDGLADALLGSAEGGHLFLWNLSTGQLLQRILLDEGLTHTACLRGYSYSGVLIVLLQHQYLGSIAREEVQSYHQEDDEGDTVSMEKEKEKQKTTLFSLVAVNALSGKSVVADRLHQPEAWSGRLCEADVLGSRLVGLSQSGSVYVWDLGGPGGPRAVWAPEADGWHVARWGGSDVLVTGHPNGDLTLYRYNDRQTSVKDVAV
ncbi:Partner and localizer of BRCA2 [Merluccius polli]|uniref:Partner and localizer of BRCA2 n=1 Tax=Merluccius polli TaxID=89951 RepID=A0AA47MUL7_MERPO|nr:Partner and localizer of BRCA2 [Merluccius polli]